MKNRIICFLTAVLLVAVAMLSAAGADREIKQKPLRYIGAMQVVRCKEFISLRSEPRKTSSRLAEIPLGEVLYGCVDLPETLFVECDYNGQHGYALRSYLRAVPKLEPPASSAVTKKMTMEEVTGSGEVILDWKDFNMSVVAVREYIKEGRKEWETLRLGCFIDGNPIWGHEEKVEVTSAGRRDMLKAFIGGIEDDAQVMLFDGAWGLSLLDLLSGKEKWCISIANCPMGNAEAFYVDEKGNTYIAGNNTPGPAAISLDGRVLWKMELGDPDIYDPIDIRTENNLVLIRYASGLTDGTCKLVTTDRAGNLISVRAQRVEGAAK